MSTTAITVFELIGWVGSICLACCGIPLFLSAVKDKEVPGANKPFLWLWYIGEWAGIIYVTYLQSYPLMFNYGLNIFLISPVLYYAYRPRRRIK